MNLVQGIRIPEVSLFTVLFSFIARIVAEEGGASFLVQGINKGEIAPGVEPASGEKLLPVGSLYDITGLPEAWTFLECLRKLMLQINEKEKELSAVFVEASHAYSAKQLVHEDILHAEGVDSESKRMAMKEVNDELVPLKEAETTAKRERDEFTEATKSVCLQHGALHTLFWAYVKLKFTELAGHEDSFGVFGTNLSVAWIERD